jgi:hypothetical protein
LAPVKATNRLMANSVREVRRCVIGSRKRGGDALAPNKWR